MTDRPHQGIPEHGWLALTNPTEIIPLHNLKEHARYDSQTHCWCQPQLIDGCIVHNAMDQCEFYERGERKPT